MMSEGSQGDSSDATSEDCNDCGEEINVEGDGPRPSWNWGLGMNVDVDMDQDASKLMGRLGGSKNARYGIKTRWWMWHSRTEEMTPVLLSPDQGQAGV
jgi:hypothetical protein